MNIRPLGKYLLLREFLQPKISEGGIRFPDNFDDPLLTQMVYLVQAKGPKCEETLVSGDRVVLDQFRLSQKTAAGPHLWLVHQDAVALVIPRIVHVERPKL